MKQSRTYSKTNKEESQKIGAEMTDLNGRQSTSGRPTNSDEFAIYCVKLNHCVYCVKLNLIFCANKQTRLSPHISFCKCKLSLLCKIKRIKRLKEHTFFRR